MNEELKFHDFAVRKNDLQNKVLAVLENNNVDVKNKLTDVLQKQNEEEKLKIAFVGQHNSGKSTIVSALTGNRQIKISGNVETDVPSDYSWEGVLLTDTPGLYAGKKEEHDALSLQKIKESDLLVFCITSSLFDDLLIKNFVDLAYKQAYKSKIFIVINKMSMENGEFDGLVKNYKITLGKTLSNEGGNFDDFPSSFIDAKDYIEGLTDSEPELVEYSNFSSFVSELNSYISDKKLFAKLDTPCRIMIGALDDEISNTSTEVDKNMIALLRQSASVVRKYKNDLKFYMHDAETDLRNEIMEKANFLISKIGSEKIDKEECDAVNKEIQNLAEKKIADIQAKLEEVQNEVITEISDVVNSDMGDFVLQSIENSDINISSSSSDNFKNSFKEFADKYNSVAGTLKMGASKAVNLAGGAEKLAKVSMVSGSQMHNIVLNVGHFFGASFKPWQAVNIAAKIGKVANVLGPILSGIAVLLEIGGKAKEEKQITEINNAKRETFNQFSSIASDIISGIEKQYMLCEKEIFDAKVKEIDDIRQEIIQNNQNNSDYVKTLKGYRDDLYKLAGDIANA